MHERPVRGRRKSPDYPITQLPDSPFVLLLFTLPVFLSAVLLFLVEPMFARMILPLLGGAPAVWNTCVVFYQVVLLAGYLYAHIVTQTIGPKGQTIVHAGLLVAALAMLPVSVNASWTPPASSNPIGAVFLLLLVSLGLPFFVIATSGPLLQRWFGGLGLPASANPYVLYAASNLGSLLALLAYPLLVEPSMSLRTQSVAWTGAYIVFGLMMAVCAVAVWRLTPPAAPAAKSLRRDVVKAPSFTDTDVRLRWLGLAVVPSTLLLSVTTYVSTDLAAVPLLWILPLSLYLATFILAFADRQIISPRLAARLVPTAAVAIVALVLAPNVYPLAMIALHLICFFIIALACHGELAATRPEVSRLTEFYVWISAGGALGGLFNTIVAPLIFTNTLEYPLAAISACLLLPAPGSWPTTVGKRVLAGAAAIVPSLLIVGAIYAQQIVDPRGGQPVVVRYAIIFAPALLACYALQRTPLRMGLALASVLITGSFVHFDNRVPLYVERTFFGVHRVMYTPTERILTSGTTNHGAQAVDASLRCEPLTYYSRNGPIGQLFASFEKAPAKSRFGVVGLGTASMAAYAKAGDTWTFYEINPAVERIARDPAYFTYLRDCAPQATVVLGDARLSLERAPDGAFDVLVLDAFSSDAIPVHLMTLEAMALYFRKLAPEGILALHISNRHLELSPVVAAVARQAGLSALFQLHQPTIGDRQISEQMSPSRWTLVARRSDSFGPLLHDARWSSLRDVAGPVWTDDYSNVFGVFRW